MIFDEIYEKGGNRNMSEQNANGVNIRKAAMIGCGNLRRDKSSRISSENHRNGVHRFHSGKWHLHPDRAI